MQQTFWVNGGDHHRRVRCVHVAEEGGRVGLLSCVWSWVSHSARPTPASGCAWAVSATLAMDDEEAEGLDCGEVSEDKNTWERTVRDVEQLHQGTRWGLKHRKRHGHFSP